MGAVNLEANSSGDIADSLGYKTSRFLKKKKKVGMIHNII